MLVCVDSELLGSLVLTAAGAAELSRALADAPAKGMRRPRSGTGVAAAPVDRARYLCVAVRARCGVTTLRACRGEYFQGMSIEQQQELAEHGAGAQLRRARPRARWSLGDRERRARQAMEQALQPALPSARAIAEQQLAHVREVTHEQAEPLVLDLARLQASTAVEVDRLRVLTDDIVSRRRSAPMSTVVFVRSEDLDVLAGLLGCPADDVTAILRHLGVLAE